MDAVLQQILALIEEKRADFADPKTHRLRAEFTFALQEAFRRIERIGMADREKIRALEQVMLRYLPPGGIDARTAMREVVGILDNGRRQP